MEEEKFWEEVAILAGQLGYGFSKEFVALELLDIVSLKGADGDGMGWKDDGSSRPSPAFYLGVRVRRCLELGEDHEFVTKTATTARTRRAALHLETVR